MALSNEDRNEIKRMIESDRKDLKTMIREEFKKLIPDTFGKSLEQIRAYFISNIT